MNISVSIILCISCMHVRAFMYRVESGGVVLYNGCTGLKAVVNLLMRLGIPTLPLSTLAVHLGRESSCVVLKGAALKAVQYWVLKATWVPSTNVPAQAENIPVCQPRHMIL